MPQKQDCTMAISEDMQKRNLGWWWRGGGMAVSLIGSHLKAKNYRQLMTGGRITSLRVETLNWLYNTMGLILKPYTEKQQKLIQQVVFIYLCIYV